ncbi:MAG: hypothetical protein U9P80_04855 [Thermodesulfobacteriota bacterium]|nr:hypothetical protein [Thermodesulfobacteriota bacterium]
MLSLKGKALFGDLDYGHVLALMALVLRLPTSVPALGSVRAMVPI